MNVLFLLIGIYLSCTNAPADTLYKKIEFTELTSGLNQAQAVYATTAGEIFITESGRNRLLMLNTLGIRIDSLGSRGSGDYSFDRPVGVHATNGMRIYVADTKNKRVQIYDRRRQYLGSLVAPNRSGFSASFFEPTLVAVNSLGESFLYDKDSDHILRYNQQGRYVNHIDLRMHEIELPLKAIAIHEESLFLIDNTYPVIHKMNSGGGNNGFITLDEAPVSLFVSERYLWALSQSYIYKLDFRGRLLEKFRHNLINTQIEGITAADQSLYILTNKKLFRATKPD